MPIRKGAGKGTKNEGKVRGGGAALGTGPFLRSVSRRAGAPSEHFPFSVPVIRELGTLSFTTQVTFFVGENGSGKSTLLEAVAAAARLPAVGSADLTDDATLSQQRELAGVLRL